MESVNKSFDVNGVFNGVKKSFEKYKSVDLDDIFEEGKVCRALSIEIASGSLIFLEVFRRCLTLTLLTGFANLLTWSMIRG